MDIDRPGLASRADNLIVPFHLYNRMAGELHAARPLQCIGMQRHAHVRL